MDVTVVTGIFDIDRSYYGNNKRSIEHYIRCFINLLRIPAPCVIFCEYKFILIVDRIRRQIPFKTTIIPVCISSLISYQPELSSYKILETSKIDLLYQSTIYSNTNYYLWLNSEYSFNTIDFSNIKLNSSHYPQNKLSLIKAKNTDLKHETLYTGFLFLSKEIVRKIHILYYNLIVNNNISNTCTYYLLSTKNPEYINLICNITNPIFDIIT